MNLNKVKPLALTTSLQEIKRTENRLNDHPEDVICKIYNLENCRTNSLLSLTLCFKKKEGKETCKLTKL